jgi:peptide/nickel transport system substrate-binding protein
MSRPIALTAAIAVSLLAVSGAGGAGAQTPKRGGTVVVAWQGGEPPCLNAWLQACTRGSDFSELLDGVLQSAFEPGPHGWRSALASRPTFTREPFTVSYRVRAQARWSDGRPITASDFVFGFRVYLKYAGLARDDHARTEIRRVEAVDSRTVRVVFRSRFSGWRSLVNFTPLPRHVLRGQDPTKVWRDRIDNPLTAAPIGNGPFLVQSWQKGRQLVLIRNPRYRGPRTYLDRLVFRFGLADFSEALRDGDADVVGGGSGGPSAALEFVQRPAPGINVLGTPGAAWEHFDINVAKGHPALKIKLVRKALAYGIDRDALVRRLFAEAAPSIRRLDSTVFLTNVSAYRPNWKMYRSNTTLARRLLERAGCRLGSDSIYACVGERLSLRFVTTAGNPRREQTLQIVQAQLRRIGVEVVPDYAPPATFFGPIFQQGDFDVALFSWHVELGNGSFPYSCGDTSNWTGYCSRLVTADLEQLERIVDPVRYRAVANRVDRRLAQAVPVIPLFQPPLFTAFRDSIQGVAPNAFSHPTWNAENWWLAR